LAILINGPAKGLKRIDCLYSTPRFFRLKTDAGVGLFSFMSGRCFRWLARAIPNPVSPPSGFTAMLVEMRPLESIRRLSRPAPRRPGLRGGPCGSRKPRRPAGAAQHGPVVMDGNEHTRRGCSDGAIRRPGGRPLPGWRAGVARVGGRRSWLTRCGRGDKHSFGPRRRAVKRLNNPMAKVPQTFVRLGNCCRAK
jgi:hypothetical protein